MISVSFSTENLFPRLILRRWQIASASLRYHGFPYTRRNPRKRASYWLLCQPSFCHRCPVVKFGSSFRSVKYSWQQFAKSNSGHETDCATSLDSLAHILRYRIFHNNLRYFYDRRDCRCELPGDILGIDTLGSICHHWN